MITIKLYNITPVVISDSLRLDLNILEENIKDTTMISSNERKFDLCLNDEIRTPHITLPAHSFLKVTQVMAKTYEYPNAGHILTENSFLFVSIKKAKLKAWAFSTITSISVDNDQGSYHS